MTPPNMRRRRILALAVVLLLAVGAGAYKALTWVPRDVRQTAIAAVQDISPSVSERDEWWVDCDEMSDRRYRCVVTWKRVDIAPSDERADFCEDWAVEVRNGRPSTPVLLEDEDRLSMRKC